MNPSPTHRSGFIALLGRPNAGKSTLLNAILGEKVAAVTPKPQTTRQAIRGIYTTPDYQMIFVDTPGYHNAKVPLNQAMVRAALRAAEEADLIAYLFDATRGVTVEDCQAVSKVKGGGAALLAALNKIDQVAKPALLPILEEISRLAPWKALVPISATEEEGVGILLEEIRRHLPEGPALYPGGQRSQAGEPFRAAEVVREKLMMRLGEELPYAIAVEIDAFEERPDQNRLSARIHVERESQKGIVIGKQGAVLKEIGTQARLELERLWGKKVFLELFVDVQRDWTRDARKLRQYGYDPQQ